MKREVFKTRNHKVFKIIDELIVEYQNLTLGENVGLSDFVKGMGCVESLKKLRERLESESLSLDFSSICDSIEYAIKTPQNYFSYCSLSHYIWTVLMKVKNNVVFII